MIILLLVCFYPLYKACAHCCHHTDTTGQPRVRYLNWFSHSILEVTKWTTTSRRSRSNWYAFSNSSVSVSKREDQSCQSPIGGNYEKRQTRGLSTQSNQRFAAPISTCRDWVLRLGKSEPISANAETFRTRCSMKRIDELLRKYSKHEPSIQVVGNSVYDDDFLLGTVHS